MDESRRRILERRARFVAAVSVMGASVGMAACEAQVCLSTVPECDGGYQGILELDVPAKVCVGDRFAVRTANVSCGGRRDVTDHAVLATSDPEKVTIDGYVAFARAPGTVTISARTDSNGWTSTTVTILACEDTGPDASNADAVAETDAGDAAASDVADSD